MHGPAIIARSMSAAAVVDRSGRQWQYHPRSDHHSKVSCWAIMFDLLQASAWLRAHAATGRIIFGINQEMRDWRTDRKKNLDLVIARPSGSWTPKRQRRTFAQQADEWNVILSAEEREELAALPELREGDVGALLAAVEAKACMTAHVRALPRLYDELTSSHVTVHGTSSTALAIGLVMVNVAATFVSPDLNRGLGPNDPPRQISTHDQPRVALRTIIKLREVARRARRDEDGFDALGIVVVDCPNDGTPITVLTSPPAPAPNDLYAYDQMIVRIAHAYDQRFENI